MFRRSLFRRIARTNSHFEPLERRRLFYADVFYDGSVDDDVYTIRLKAGDANTVEVIEQLGFGSPVTHTHAVNDVRSINFDTGAGYDRLVVDERNGPLVFDFNIHYQGGEDFDELLWECPSTADDFEFYNGAIIDNELTVFEFDDVIEDVTINGNGGADVFSADSNDAGSHWVINGGEGDDLLDIYGGNLEAIESEITFNGGNGVDTIYADDSFVSFDDSYTITTNSLSRDNFSGLTFSGSEGLVLDCEEGSNNILLNSVSAGMSVTVNGGDGFDSLYANTAVPAGLLFTGGLDPDDVNSLVVNAGTYMFNADAATHTANLSVSANGPSAIVFNTSQHLRALNLNNANATVTTGGNKTIVTETLSIENGGRLNLRDNDLIIRSGTLGASNGTNYDGVSGLIRSGRASGAWTGEGIVTSMSSAVTPQTLTTLGVATASQVLGIATGATGVWNGETVAGSAVLVKYTYAGDANLSGTIDADDYFAIDSNYNDPPTSAGYFKGDFNYSGAINGDDFFIIDTNHGPAGSGGALGMPVGAAEWFAPVNRDRSEEVATSIIDDILSV